MLLVIPEEGEKQLLEQARSLRQGVLGPFLVSWREPEGLLRAFWEPPDTLPKVRGVSVALAREDAPLPEFPPGEPLLIIAIYPQGKLRAFFEWYPGRREECSVDVVHWRADIFSRSQAIFKSAALADKTATIIGLGSGGSLAAVELAKCGLGGFILVDFDRLKAVNVSRHACGLADVGRYKTRAVADLLRNHDPLARIACYDLDITQEPDKLREFVQASSIVLAATDNEVSKYLINEVCLELGKPAVYAGAYERAFAGEVIRVVPRETACYACVRLGLAETMRTVVAQEEVEYTTEVGFKAEPGLGLDVGFIALFQAKLALLTLLRGAETTLQDIDADMVIWVNAARPADGQLFARPMARHFARVAVAADCPACQEIRRGRP